MLVAHPKPSDCWESLCRHKRFLAMKATPWKGRILWIPGTITLTLQWEKRKEVALKSKINNNNYPLIYFLSQTWRRKERKQNYKVMKIKTFIPIVSFDSNFNKLHNNEKIREPHYFHSSKSLLDKHLQYQQRFQTIWWWDLLPCSFVASREASLMEVWFNELIMICPQRANKTMSLWTV